MESGSWRSCSARPTANLKRAGLPSDSVDWVRLLEGPLLELVRAGEIDNARATVLAATGL